MLMDSQERSAAYQQLMDSILSGLSDPLPNARHAQRNGTTSGISSSSGDLSDGEAAIDTQSQRSGRSMGSPSQHGGCSEPMAAEQKDQLTAGLRAGTTRVLPQSLPDAGPVEAGADKAAWLVPSWVPEVDAPDVATASAAGSRWRQRHKVAPLMQPGAAQLARAPVQDVRKDARMAARNKSASAGASWFDMKAPIITPEVKRDWRLLRLRSAYNPRHFYKGFDSTKIPKHFEMGTIVEGVGEFYSGRLTKKERKQTFTEEILADLKIKKERKRRFDQMQAEREELARKRKKMKAHHKRSAHRPKH